MKFLPLMVLYLNSPSLDNDDFKSNIKIYHPDIGYKLAAGDYADAADCPAT